MSQVVAKITGTTLINDPNGTLSCLFEHMVTKMATTLLNSRDVETVAGANLAIDTFEDLGKTLLVFTQAYRTYSEGADQ